MPVFSRKNIRHRTIVVRGSKLMIEYGWFLLLVQFLPLLLSVDAADNHNNDANNTNTIKAPKRIISLSQSMEISRSSMKDPHVEETRRKFWDEAFADIRKLASSSVKEAVEEEEEGAKLTHFPTRWKLLSSDANFLSFPTTVATSKDEHSSSNAGSVSNDTGADGANETQSMFASYSFMKPQRFDGFPSWDRMVQEWSDDIQEYLDSVSEESDAGYSLGNFGRAPSPLESTTTNAAIAAEKDNISESSTVEESRQGTDFGQTASPVDKNWKEISETVRQREKEPILKPVTPAKLALPIPAPARPGEPVLPHTDIGDKSKRLLIVTTASLPWKTGTAVNPLLRAAYLTYGRKDAGGSVTLMLPWLERKEDQDRVYGANDSFSSPDEQEQYIRTWLHESANMPEASQELKIQWYTAWQNKAENSIYSMGDITATISAEDVDICILEEPEHLNWYRAPGESWTKKFKHVVGILHTNYFSYALDQPAALIRVRCID
jgi:hypothetical protein